MVFDVEKMGEGDFQRSVLKRDIGIAENFIANVEDGFDTGNTLGPVWNEFKAGVAEGKSPFEILNNPIIQKGFNLSSDEDKRPLTQDEWKNSEFYREDIQWKEGMTQGRARVYADSFDRVTYNRSVSDRSEGLFQGLVGLAGQFVSQVPDPINLVPFGMGAKAAKTTGAIAAKATGKFISEGAKKAMIKTGTASAMENLAAAAVTRPYWEERGIESSWIEYASDITIGGLLGTSLGLLGFKWGQYKEGKASKLLLNVSNKSRNKLSEIVQTASEAVARGDNPPDLKKIPGAMDAINEVWDLESVKRSSHAKKLIQQLTDSGMDEADAKLGLAPMMAHAEALHKAFGMDFDTFLNKRGIEELRVAKGEPRFKASKLIGVQGEDLVIRNGANTPKIKPLTEIESSPEFQKILDDEIAQMIYEVNSAEVINHVTVDGRGDVNGRNYQNTFPEFYRTIGAKNKEDFAKIAASKKGKRYERIKQVALDRLENGYVSKASGPMEPHNGYRQMRGMEPIFIQAEMGKAIKGEVTMFDGHEGMIKTPTGEMVYFDSTLIPEGRKINVGDQVQFEVGDNPKFKEVGKFFQEYRGQHTAPASMGKNGLVDISEQLPGIYEIDEKTALQYYGFHNKKDDLAAIRIIKKMKDKPNGKVKIYRAVPEGVERINSGDWVSLTRGYAELHAEANGGRVIEMEVEARELFNAGDIQEWGYQKGGGETKTLFQGITKQTEMPLPEKVRVVDVKKLDRKIFDDNYFSNTNKIKNHIEGTLKNGDAINTALNVEHGDNYLVLRERDLRRIIENKFNTNERRGMKISDQKKMFQKQAAALLNIKELTKNATFIDVDGQRSRFYYSSFNYEGELVTTKIKTRANGEIINVEVFGKRYSGEVDLTGAAPTSTKSTGLVSSNEGSMARATQGPNELSINELMRNVNEGNAKSRFYQTAPEADARGSVTFLEDGRNIVNLFENADQSTLLHETGHIFLRNLEDLAAMADAPEQIRADWGTIREWLGVKEGKALTVEHHEKFARGFELYLREGEAPNNALKRAFETFRNWLTSIYKNAEELNVKLNDDVREVYNRLLGGDGRPSFDMPEIETPRLRSEIDDVEIDDFYTKRDAGSLSPSESDAVLSVREFETKADEAKTVIDKAGEVFTLFQSKKPDELAKQLQLEIPGLDKREADEIIAIIQGKAKAIDPNMGNNAIKRAVKELTEAIEQQKAFERRQLYLQARAKDRLAKFVADAITKTQDPEKAILAYLEGNSSLRDIEGSGRAVHSDYQALSQYWLSDFSAKLKEIDPEIHRLFNDDPGFNERVISEMWQIREDGLGKPGVSGDPIAVKVANLISKTTDDARKRINLAGANIGKLEGWVPRSHDYEKMIKAGKQKWVKYMLDNLDFNRTLAGLSEVERGKALESIFDDLITGVHGVVERPDLGGPSILTPSNIAKKLGKHRELHFKSAAGELDYLKNFGRSNIMESTIQHLDGLARKSALMERLGPNPDTSLAFIIDDIREGVRKGTILKNVDDLKRRKLLEKLPNKNELLSRQKAIGRAMSVITGESRITENVTLSSVSSFIRANNSLSKLMGATLSQFGDILNVVNENKFVRGKTFADSWVEALGVYFEKMTPEKQRVLDRLGVVVDGMNAMNFNRFDAMDGLNQKWAWLTQKGFQLSGMEWITNKGKTGFALGLSKDLADVADLDFNSLGRGLREALSQFGGIDAHKWDLIRNVAVTEIDGNRFLVPDLIQKIDDLDLDALLDEKFRFGTDVKIKKPEKLKAWQAGREANIKRVKNDLEMSLRSFFIEETRNAVLEPDARTTRYTTGGTRAGTATGEAWRLLMQFKSFAITYTHRTLGGRRMMESGLNFDAGGVAHHILASALLGYVSMVAKDIAKGRVPRDPSDPKTWPAALMQSGGLGVVGDLLQASNNRFGGTMLSTLAGPTAGNVDQVGKIFGKVVTGDVDIASDMVNLAKNNTPFINLWYSRAALDYLFFYNLQEALNPGSVRRMQRRLKKESNQEFMIDPLTLHK